MSARAERNNHPLDIISLTVAAAVGQAFSPASTTPAFHAARPYSASGKPVSRPLPPSLPTSSDSASAPTLWPRHRLPSSLRRRSSPAARPSEDAPSALRGVSAAPRQ